MNEENFWGIWEKFEVYHGNQDTYADYMRAKRTVELRFSVVMPVVTTQIAVATNLDVGEEATGKE
jgi:hypothetical protein